MMQPCMSALPPPMLIGGIALGLILGLLAGGSIDEPRLGPAAPHRAARRSRSSSASAPRSLLNPGVPIAEHAPRCRSSPPPSALLLVALWANRGYPGMSLAFIGVLVNAVVILVNGGYMPI